MNNKPLEQILDDFRRTLQEPEEVKAMLKCLDSPKNRALTGKEYESLRDSYFALKQKGAGFDLKELSQKLEERISHDVSFWESQADPILAMDATETVDFHNQIAFCKYFVDEFKLPSRKKIKRLKYIYEQKQYSGGKMFFDFRLTGSLPERVLRAIKKSTAHTIEKIPEAYQEIKGNKDLAGPAKAILGICIIAAGALVISGTMYYVKKASIERLEKRIAERKSELEDKGIDNPELFKKLAVSREYEIENLSHAVQSPDKNREVILYRDNELILADKKGDVKLRSVTDKPIDDVSRVYWEGNDDLVLVKNKTGGEKYVKLHILPNRFIHLGGEVDSLDDISRIVYSPDKEYGAFFVRNKNCVFIFDKTENYQLINEMFDRINRIYWESNKTLAVDTPNCGHPLRINTDEIGK